MLEDFLKKVKSKPGTEKGDRGKVEMRSGVLRYVNYLWYQARMKSAKYGVPVLFSMLQDLPRLCPAVSNIELNRSGCTKRTTLTLP